MKKSLKLQENVSLAPLTTLKIGGDARFFVNAKTEEEIVAAVDHARAHGLDLFVLGGGSNVLISDAGFDGLVLKIGISSEFRVPGSELSGNNSEPGTRNSELFSAVAGEDWDRFVEFCVDNDLAGVECLSGIPGFIGGTPVQNVGAYGQEVSETIVSVRCLDRSTGEIITLANADCGFTYRTSIFNSTHRDRYIVLSVTFELEYGGAPKVVYKDLIEYFGERQPTLRETRDAVLAVRRAKSMVIDPMDPNSKSAGSFFKNPVVEREKLDEIRSAFANVPHFEFDDKVKIPAAWLIENAGFHKGYSLGCVGLSSNHVLAIINRGGGTAREVLDLKQRIESQVMEKFGILLYPEPLFVGFPPSET